MGQEIVYCARCKSRIKGGDFEARRAFKLSNRHWCADCVQDLMPSLSADAREKLRKLMSEGSTLATPSGRSIPEPAGRGTTRIRPTTGSTVLADAARGHRAGRKPAMLVGIAAAGLVVVVVAIVLGAAGGSAPRDRRAKKGHRSRPSPAVNGKISGTRNDADNVSTPPRLRAVIEFAKRNPEKLEEIVEKFDALLWDSEGTSLFEPVKAARAPFLKKLSERIEQELSEVRQGTRRLVGDRRFPEAFVYLDRQRARWSRAEWTSGIDRIRRGVEKELDQYWTELSEKAAAVENPEEVKKILRPVLSESEHRELEAVRRKAEGLLEEKRRAWEIAKARTPKPDPRNRGESKPERALSAAEREREEKEYEEFHRQILDLCSQRRLEDAVLRYRGRSCRDGELRRRTQREARALQYATGLIARVYRDLEAMQLSGEVSLRYTGPGNRRCSIRGKVLWTLANRIEIESEKSGPTFVELLEIEPASMVRLYRNGGTGRGDSEEDRLRAGYFLLFCGEIGAAKEAFGSSVDRVPDHLWEFGREVQKVGAGRKEKIEPGRVRRETEAREAFYRALRESRDPKTMDRALRSFRDILGKYGDTAYVKLYHAEIQDRADNMGREVVLDPLEVRRGTGVWERRKMSKAPFAVVWYAKGDPEDENYRENFLDVEFYVEGGRLYDIWVLCYICCRKTAEMFLQGTDLQITNDRGERLSAEVGGKAVIRIPAVQGVRGLPENHQHGPGRHAWRWLRIWKGLNYPASGVKRLRIMTDVGDLAVSHIVVTSVRNRMPRNSAELRRLAGLR